jgi:histidinol-phosphate phosphatase family protein
MPAKNRAVFVDRDGTLNINIDYLSDPARYQLYPGVASGLKMLRDAGFIIVVVTNQSGIGRGIFDERTLEMIHLRMKELLALEGASVDAIYFCPHHPNDRCACRKPGTALFERAVRELDIDPESSFVIGDTELDVGAGKKMGAMTALVPEPRHRARTLGEMKNWNARPDFVGEDFLDAVRWVLGKRV